MDTTQGPKYDQSGQIIHRSIIADQQAHKEAIDYINDRKKQQYLLIHGKSRTMRQTKSGKGSPTKSVRSFGSNMNS